MCLKDFEIVNSSPFTQVLHVPHAHSNDRMTDSNRSDELKQKGNASFASGDFKNAISLFSLALDVDPSSHILLSNRSAAHASLKDYKSGLADAQRCTELSPHWAKGYSRLGACHWGLSQWVLCASAYSKGLQIEPGNEAMKKGLEEARAQIRTSRGKKKGEGTDGGGHQPPPQSHARQKKGYGGKRREVPEVKNEAGAKKRQRRDLDSYDDDFIDDSSQPVQGKRADDEEEEEEIEVCEEGELSGEEEEEEIEAAMRREEREGDSDEDGSDEDQRF